LISLLIFGIGEPLRAFGKGDFQIRRADACELAMMPGTR
jgi:hypothetical protein